MRRRYETTEYYAKRAAEYERIYEKPERQDDLARLQSILAGAFGGLDVLEVACGTGYWTRYAARSARSILAIDYNEAVLEIARRKDYGDCQVDFVEADVYTLGDTGAPRSAGLAAFWWSHVPKRDFPSFLGAFHANLKDGAPVFVLDNRYVEGSSTPVARADEEGNTYQVRTLSDGSRHDVLKNFTDETEFRNALDGYGTVLDFELLDYFWLARYESRRPAA